MSGLIARLERRLTATDATVEQHRRDRVVLALLTTAIAVTGTMLGMLAPLLVPLGADFGWSVGQMGQLAAVTALPWGISAPVAGPFSDRFGRKPILLLGFGLSGTATVLSAFVGSLELLFALRFIAGIGLGATGGIIMAYVADYFPPDRQSRAYGTVLTGFPIGAILGVPAVALTAGLFGWRWSFALVGVAVLLLFSATLLVLPHLRPPGSASLNILAPLLPVLRRPTVLLLFLANTGERGGTMLAATYLPAFLMQTYGLAVEATAGPLIWIALGTLVGSWLGGRLADRFPKPAVFGLTELSAGLLGLLLFWLALSLAFTTVVAALIGLLGAAGRPALMWLVSHAAAEQRGAVLGLYSTSNQVAFTFSTTLGGLLLGDGGFGPLSLLCLALGLVAAAPCAALARRPAGP